MPDRGAASGSWVEKTNPNFSRVNQLLDYYRYQIQKDKNDEQIRKQSPTKSKGYLSVAVQLQQRYLSTKKPSAFSNLPAMSGFPVTLKEVKIEPSVTVGLDEVEQLSDNIYNVDLVKSTSLSQRHRDTIFQPQKTDQWWPQKMRTSTKQSLRCKKCDHNIIKPEYNPQSIKFKIHLIALKYVPEFRVNKVLNKFTVGKPTKVILSLINPTEHIIHVEMLKNEELDSKCVNAQIELPSSKLVVGKFDDAAEYLQPEDLAANPETTGKDDPKLIAFRRGNKVGFYVQVTPNEGVTSSDDVIISFKFTHEHYDSSTIVARLKGTVDEATIKPKELTHCVRMSLGRLSSA